MSSIFTKIVLLAFAMPLLGACTTTQPRYSDARYQDTQQNAYYGYANRCEYCGTIERIDTVWDRDDSLGGGTVLGAVIGGLAGTQVGSGSGRKAAVAAGALAGGVIGHQVEQGRRAERPYHQFRVRLDDGRIAHVTQIENPGLRVNDRVQIRNDLVERLHR